MTHWITPVHEINRSCVDVKGERKRVVPQRVPKTKFPTKLRGQTWNNLINSPKTRMSAQSCTGTRLLRALPVAQLSVFRSFFFFFAHSEFPHNCQSMQGGNHTTTAPPSPGRPGRNTHARAHGRPWRRVTPSLLEFTRSSSVYRVTHREIKGKTAGKKRNAMKLTLYV